VSDACDNVEGLTCVLTPTPQPTFSAMPTVGTVYTVQASVGLSGLSCSECALPPPRARTLFFTLIDHSHFVLQMATKRNRS
jgi:hypothetical protein